jgi:hypothetical protein
MGIGSNWLTIASALGLTDAQVHRDCDVWDEGGEGDHVPDE